MSALGPVDELVVLLGHRNSQSGELSRDALSRVDVAVRILRDRAPNGRVALVATGGFGFHFNKSNIPHGKLLVQELMKHDIKGVLFLNHIHSCGTLEDAIGVLRTVRSMPSSPLRITVITSEYHRRRVEFIFSRLFPYCELSFEVDKNLGTADQVKHEELSLRKLYASLPNIADVSNENDSSVSSLSEELRHYDNLSYLALAASFLTVYYAVNSLPSISNIAPKLFAAVSMIIISVLFYLIYFRLAGTAGSARRIISAISFLQSRPHLGSSQNRASSLSPKIAHAAAWSLAVAWLGALVVSFFVSL